MARPIAKRRRAGSSQRCDFWLFAPRKSEPANRRAGTSCAFRVCGVATTTTTAPARTVAACGALSFRSRSSFDLRHPCSGDRGFWSETDSNPLSSLKKNPLVETVCSTFQACPFREGPRVRIRLAPALSLLRTRSCRADLNRPARVARASGRATSPPKGSVSTWSA